MGGPQDDVTSRFPTAAPFAGAYAGGLCAAATVAGIALLAWDRATGGWALVGGSTVLFVGLLVVSSRLEARVNLGARNPRWSTVTPFALPAAMGSACATAAGLLLVGLREPGFGSLALAVGVTGALGGTAWLVRRDRQPT